MAVSRHIIIHIGKKHIDLKKKKGEKKRKKTQDTVVSIDIHRMG
jgi:hypothetical protein